MESGGGNLEAVLLLAFLDQHRATPLSGEPSPDPEAGLEIDSADFLEQYLAFLSKEGRLTLALRTWRLCRLTGEIPPSVRRRIEATEKTLASVN